VPRGDAFQVSVSFVVNLVKAFRAPKPSGGRRHAKLEPHRATIGLGSFEATVKSRRSCVTLAGQARHLIRLIHAKN
jgi:hypothetical protein